MLCMTRARFAAGAVFVAMRGGTTDGNRYVESALQMGTAAIVTDDDSSWQQLRAAHPSLAIAKVEHGRRALAGLSANLFGHPEEKLKLSGVTGTNGKTTTTWLLESMLRGTGRNCVLAGTIEYHVAGEIRPSPHTTPESRDLYRLLADGVAAAATEAVMEVSSHALDQGRVWGLHWDTAVFTNLTQDHLDYHGNMESYFEAKAKLFAGQGTAPPRVAILHAADEYGERMIARARAAECCVVTYGLDGGDFCAQNIQLAAHGMRFRMATPAGAIDLQTRLAGPVNVLNLLAASAAAMARGLSLEEVARGVEAIENVPGRFQTIDCGQPFTVVVDYAHTDDALRNVTRAGAVARRSAQWARDYGVWLRRRPRPIEAPENGPRRRRGQRFRGCHQRQPAHGKSGSHSRGDSAWCRSQLQPPCCRGGSRSCDPAGDC